MSAVVNRSAEGSTRKRYANDLHDGRALVAVSASSNRSKSDRDVTDWMPRYGKCRYAMAVTAVKLRWGLSANQAEKRKMKRLSRTCQNSVIRYIKANTRNQSGGGSGGAGGGGGGLDPRFKYCYQAIAAGYGPYYKGRDGEYPWYTDSDNDGVVCES